MTPGGDVRCERCLGRGYLPEYREDPYKQITPLMKSLLLAQMKQREAAS